LFLDPKVSSLFRSGEQRRSNPNNKDGPVFLHVTLGQYWQESPEV
jgi:hypothetical protein